jgi:hypothetical protein
VIDIMLRCWQVTNSDSLLHLEDTFDRHIDTVSKLNYALFNHVADIVNARYDTRTAPHFEPRELHSRRN